MLQHRREDYDRLCRVYRKAFAAPPPEHLFASLEAGIRLMTYSIFTGAPLTQDDEARGDD